MATSAPGVQKHDISGHFNKWLAAEENKMLLL